MRKVPVNIAALVPHLKPSFYDSTFDKIMALFLQRLMCVTSEMILIVRLCTVVVFGRRLAFAEYVSELFSTLLIGMYILTCAYMCSYIIELLYLNDNANRRRILVSNCSLSYAHNQKTVGGFVIPKV